MPPVYRGEPVSAVVALLSKQYPRIAFHVVAAEAERCMRLAERSIDLLVAWRFGPSTTTSSFEVLYDDRYAVVTGAKKPVGCRRRIQLAKLMNESWALPCRIRS